MFLNVGDKVYEMRKLYSIKQSGFKAFGVPQNYISMIEKNKRQVTPPYVHAIFNAFMILTEGKILEHYTLAEFILSDTEQAKRWLQQNYSIECGMNNYDKYVNIALHYSLFEPLLEFEVLLAYHYKGEHDLLKSIGHFLKAISYGVQLKQDVAIYYRQIGLAYIDLGQYKEAEYYLLLALDYCLENESNQFYTICYDLARAYYNLKNYDECIRIIECVSIQETNLMLKACGVLLLSSAIRKNNQFDAGFILLTDFIKNCFYEPLLHCAYHNLICCYDDAKMYDLALDVFEKSLSYQPTAYYIAKTNCMGGLVYVHCEKFDLGLTFLEKGYRTVLEEANLNQKENIIIAMSMSYFKLNQLDKLILFMNELDSFEKRGLIPLTHILSNKNSLYELVLREVISGVVDVNKFDALLNRLKH